MFVGWCGWFDVVDVGDGLDGCEEVWYGYDFVGVDV